MKNPSLWPNRLAIIFLALGLTRMTGYFLDSKILQGIGAASGIAPFTKVFSETDGYEAFTASFCLRGRTAEGGVQEIALTPERYARLRGPYQRRNVYGAALVFAPRLPERLRESLHARALLPGSVLREELGIPSDWVAAELVVRPREGSADTSFTYSIPCQ